MEGQVFVTSAVAFAALIIIASLPSGPSASAANGVQEFFGASLTSGVEAFDGAVSRNSSPEYVEREMYGHLWFLERLTRDRNLGFASYVAVVFPERSELRFINFGNSEVEARILAGGSWTNTTVAAKESLELRFSSGTSSFSFRAGDLERSVEAYTPRTVIWMRMRSSSQSWQNSRVA